MNTKGRPSFIVRLYDWLLDRDGDIYGDERSRFAWYEAIAGSASVQSLAIPWSLAIMVWFVPPSAIWALTVVLAVQVISSTSTLPYLKAKRIDFLQPQKSSKAKLVQGVSMAAYVIFALGTTLGADLRKVADVGALTGALAGGMVGGFGALGAWWLFVKQNQKRVATADLSTIDAELD